MSGQAALPPLRQGLPAPDAIAQARAQMAGAAAAGAWASDPPGVETTLGGVRALRFSPPGKPRVRVLQFHGGGFRLGMPEYCGPFAAALVRKTGASVHAVHYRLAPEHPFPAGLADGWAALQALAGQDERARIVVLGDSAGGGIAAGVALLAAANGVALNGLALLSPWLDLTVTASTYEANAASDPLFSRAAAEAAAQLYLQGHDPYDPLASPLFADLAGLPPTLVSVGSGEVLLGDARAFAARLRAAGVDTALCEIAGMDHVAALRGADLPGAAETFAAVRGLIERAAAAN